MLGKLIRVCVTDAVGAPMPNGEPYNLNHGTPIGKFRTSSPISGVLILGIDNPVKHFDGRVIASLRFRDTGEIKLIAAPKSKKYIDCEIRDSIEFYTNNRPFNLDCYYERSCGAVVYRRINNEIRYLLIRNRRSSNWSFPKGHVEKGETLEDTAIREVFEETGLRINIYPGFKCKSEYTIQNKIQKTVQIFVASTNDTQTKIQVEEIEDYIWLTFENAYKHLKFENDKTILKDARDYLITNNYISEENYG
jgi:8-oxo-dGTP pyrophosphatase MutT (NUDIX family)